MTVKDKETHAALGYLIHGNPLRRRIGAYSETATRIRVRVRVVRVRDRDRDRDRVRVRVRVRVSVELGLIARLPLEYRFGSRVQVSQDRASWHAAWEEETDVRLWLLRAKDRGVAGVF